MNKDTKWIHLDWQDPYYTESLKKKILSMNKQQLIQYLFDNSVYYNQLKEKMNENQQKQM